MTTKPRAPDDGIHPKPGTICTCPLCCPAKYAALESDRLAQLEARCARLAAALRDLLELTDETDGTTPLEQQRHLTQDLQCEGVRRCRQVTAQGGAVLLRTPGAGK